MCLRLCSFKGVYAEGTLECFYREQNVSILLFFRWIFCYLGSILLFLFVEMIHIESFMEIRVYIDRLYECQI